ncbi:MAG TPA: PilZ domain-containing protein, partial [Gemmataceae bacterium]|nr:PilZ domain-containing protein [Gemmataceae bacterium]
LVEALEAAGAVKEAADSLPPVAPYCWLRGEPVPSDLVVPSAEQLLRDVIRAVEGPLQICRFGGGHYVLRPGPVLEHRCPIRFFPGAMRLKMSGFRQQWGAEVVSRDQNSYVCRVLSTRSFWQRCVGGQTGMEVQVHVPPGAASDGQLSEATIRILPFGGLAAGDDERFAAAASGLLESMRSYLQACPEQRAKPRWPFPHPLHVYPVLDNRELAAEITGRGKDLSLCGIGFVVAQPPSGDRFYVRLGTAEFVLLAQVVRVRPLADGGYEVGAAFLRDGLPAES